MSPWTIAAFLLFFPLLLGTMGVAKLLFFREKPDEDKFVTRRELREAMDGLRRDIKFQLETMDKYMHDVAHAQANLFQQIVLKLERLTTLEETKVKNTP